jgi:hypothetical protein
VALPTLEQNIITWVVSVVMKPPGMTTADQSFICVDFHTLESLLRLFLCRREKSRIQKQGPCGAKAIRGKEFPFFPQMKRYCKTGNDCYTALSHWLVRWINSKTQLQQHSCHLCH